MHVLLDSFLTPLGTLHQVAGGIHPPVTEDLDSLHGEGCDANSIVIRTTSVNVTLTLVGLDGEVRVGELLQHFIATIGPVELKLSKIQQGLAVVKGVLVGVEDSFGCDNHR